jgi:hypothetical protein
MRGFRVAAAVGSSLDRMQTLVTRMGSAPLSRRIIVVGDRWRALFFALLAMWALNCGASSPSGPRPEAALSADSVAQVRFRELSEKWHSSSPETRQQLEGPLRRYLEDFPYDASRRRAWTYLGWILVRRGELLEARELVDRVKSGPPGSVSDFAFVVDAALLLELNQPQEAVRLLRPVRSKLIDPAERWLATEQLVLAALRSELYGEALLYMVDWGASAPVTERTAVRESITSHLSRIPRRYLEHALLELEASEAEAALDPARRDQEDWQRDAIAKRLTAIAVEERDPDLARFVLEQSDILGSEPNTAQDLIDLATKSGTNAVVHGRTLGVLLTTETAEQRRRSSEVASAVATALGLPLVLPQPGTVRVVFAQDSGGASGATAAFQSLAMQGAAVVIGGVDSNSAQHHSWQAERSGLPVLVLHPHQLERVTWTYTVGANEMAEQQALFAELAARGFSKPRFVAADDGACREDAKRALTSHFQSWSNEGADSVVFLGGRDCARRLIETNPRGHKSLFIGLGLEAASAAEGQSDRTVALGSERYPFDATSEELTTWMARNGKPPTWYEALGHDAALLAKSVLSSLPDDQLSRPAEVNAHYDRVRVALRRKQAVSLWTAPVAQFDDALTLERRFRFVPARSIDLPAAPR